MKLQSQIVSKIRRLRHEKMLTQPQMAELLNLEESVYSRLETGKTCSWAKYLEELLGIFEITPLKFFEDIGTAIVIKNNCSNNVNGISDNYNSVKCETCEKLIASKDEQISLLKKMLYSK